MNKCPKCNSEYKIGETECKKCGIIFAKYEELMKKKQEAISQKEETAKRKEQKKLEIKNRMLAIIERFKLLLKRKAEKREKEKRIFLRPSSKIAKKQSLMMKCNVCDKEISKNAAACPHCGEPNKIEDTINISADEINKSSSPIIAIMLWIVIIATIAIGYNEYYYSNSYDALTRRVNKKYTELNLVALSRYIKGLNGTEVSWRGQIYSIERKGERALISIDMNPEKGGVFPVPDITFTIDYKDAQLLTRGEIVTASGQVSKITPCPFANSFFWELSDVKVR